MKIVYFGADFLELFLSYRDTVFGHWLGCLGIRHDDGLGEQDEDLLNGE